MCSHIKICIMQCLLDCNIGPTSDPHWANLRGQWCLLKRKQKIFPLHLNFNFENSTQTTLMSHHNIFCTRIEVQLAGSTASLIRRWILLSPTCVSRFPSSAVLFPTVSPDSDCDTTNERWVKSCLWPIFPLQGFGNELGICLCPFLCYSFLRIHTYI